MSDTSRTDDQIGHDGSTMSAIRIEFVRQLERELNAANERIKRQEEKVGLLCDALDSAWTLIANVDEGEWDKQQTRGWIECATKWRTDQLTPAWKLVMEHRKKGTPHA